MDSGRRKVLQGTSGAAVLGLAMAAWALQAGQRVGAVEQGGVRHKSLNDAVKALGGTTASESKDIVITSPDIAENGAVVPFTMESKLPKTESMRSSWRRTPTSWAASFSIPDGTQPLG
jgi:sulfur-oxidizing protein SoxY